jgi:hypothetical protein
MAEEIIQRNGIMVLLDIVGFTKELRHCPAHRARSVTGAFTCRICLLRLHF